MTNATSDCNPAVDLENHTKTQSKPAVLVTEDCCPSSIRELLNKYHLELNILEKNQIICGSFWGDSEAGIIGNNIFVRPDTPVHSLLHETCHFICMDQSRREVIDTNAGGNYEEENAVCYLQILLAEDITEFSSQRMMQDMNSWGYTFRLGSAEEWFKNDAEDALAWLQKHNLLNSNNLPNYSLRK